MISWVFLLLSRCTYKGRVFFILRISAALGEVGWPFLLSCFILEDNDILRGAPMENVTFSITSGSQIPSRRSASASIY